MVGYSMPNDRGNNESNLLIKITKNYLIDIATTPILCFSKAACVPETKQTQLKCFLSHPSEISSGFIYPKHSCPSQWASSLQDGFSLFCLKRCSKDKDMQFLTSTDTGQGTNPCSLTLIPHMVWRFGHKVFLPNLFHQSWNIYSYQTVFWVCLLSKTHWGIWNIPVYSIC